MSRRAKSPRTARSRSSVLRPACDLRSAASFIEGLENRVLLSTTPVPLTTPLNTSSGQVQTVLQTAAKLDELANQILKIDAQLASAIGKLPLVGDGVKDAIGGANDKFKAVATTIENALKTLSNPTVNGVDIQNALFAALGPSGANILPASITTAAQVPVTLSDTDGTAGDAEQVDLNLNLTGTLFTASLNPSFDLDLLPGLGLSLNGTVQAQLSYDIHLDIGVNNTDFFYLDLGKDNPELSLTLDITTPGLSADGTLGFLQLHATDGTANGNTKLTGKISADLGVPGGKLTASNLGSLTSNSSLSADAQMDLHLHNVLSFGGSAKFPSLQADLDLTWKLGGTSLNSGGVATSSGAEPDLQFNNVKLDLGTFFSNFVTPIVDQVRTILGPLQPLFDLLDTRMPIFSDIGFLSDKFNTNGDDHVSLLEVLDFLGGGNTKFITTVAEINDLVNHIPTIGGTALVDLGRFELGGTSHANGADIRSLAALADVNLTSFTPADLTAALGALGPAGEAAGDFLSHLASGALGGAGGADGGGFHFPIIENPSSAFGLLLGKNVDLFTFDTPTLDLKAPLDEFFSILGPLGVELKGTLDDDNTFAMVKAHLSGGYDTAGIVEFANAGFAPSHIPDLFDGFYVIDDPAKTYASAGLGIGAYAALNVVVASAGVGGGINGTITFTVNDPGEETPPPFDDGFGADGRLRPKEIIANLAMSPLCLFDITGKITASLDAFVRVGFDTPFGFVGWSDHWTLAETTLADFSFGCDTMPPSPPALATLLGDGTLRLNMGPNAAARVNGDLTDGDESFVVSHLSTEGDGTETVNVTAFGYVQKYTGVKRIYAEGGNGNDTIELQSGIASPAELYGDFTGAGGDGADKLTAADGPSTLHGGGGDDQLVTTGGASTMYGDDGDDLLIGASAADHLDGGAGDDRAFGHGGNDSLYGQAGEDYLNGGDGDDILDGGTEGDHLLGGTGNDTANGGDGNDVLEGNDGSDQISGGDGNDLIFGDNVLPPSASFTPITKDNNLLAGLFLNVLTGPSYGVNLLPGGSADSLDGGAGSDSIYGEGGNDTIRGDSGNDYLQGNADDDQMDGGSENDSMIGGLGSDSMTGGTGNDVMLGDDGEVSNFGLGLPSDSPADGNDTMDGGSGSDRLWGQGGADLMNGGDDADTLSGGAGADTMHGNGANDSLSGGTGADSMFGDAGDDTLNGDAGDDTMQGNAGNDLMSGGDNDDLMSGGADNDTMSGDGGADVMTGDAGNDSMSGGAGADLMSGNDDDDSMSGGDGDDSMFGNAGNDTLAGDANDDDMVGGAGSDLMTGGTGHDVMLGDDGTITRTGAIIFNTDGTPRTPERVVTLTLTIVGAADTMSGGDGHDRLWGQDGDDSISGDAGDDDLIGNAGNDSISGGSGYDAILGDDGTITTPAGITPPAMPESAAILRTVTPLSLVLGGNDLISAGDDDDIVYGQGGNDTVFAGAGDDYVEGNAGSDSISGDAGDDDLIGGSSVAGTPDAGDWISGGDGHDVIVGDNGTIARTVVAGNVWDRYTAGVTTGTGRGAENNAPIRAVNLLDRDTIGGADTESGGAGDDTMFGGLGNDSMAGDDGNDDMVGNLGDDRMDGGAGSDGIVGDNGTIVTDLLDGSTQASLSPQGNFVTVTVNRAGTLARYVTLIDPAAGGNDVITGGDGDDFVHAGAGADLVSGDAGNDALFGDDGNDTMSGGNGDDHLYGGAGDDSLDGNAGADLIYGGDGDDWLIADSAGDRLIDWFGNYNNFVVPGPSYGAKIILRSPAPQMQQFLLDLAKADGSLNPDLELLVVTPPSPSNSGPGGRTN